MYSEWSGDFSGEEEKGKVEWKWEYIDLMMYNCTGG
jgi:hypothetical protein